MLVTTDRSRLESAISRTARDGTPLDIEVRVIRPFNRTMWVRILGTPRAAAACPTN